MLQDPTRSSKTQKTVETPHRRPIERPDRIVGCDVAAVARTGALISRP